jgi:ankyrin repeat protein
MISAQSSAGSTALYHAISGRHISIVRLLLQAGIDHDVRNDDGDTALTEAVRRGEEETLLERGADPNLPNKTTKMTLLHQKYSLKRTNTARLLIQYGASVSAQNCDGETPLHVACQLVIPEFVQLLPKHGADT